MPLRTPLSVPVTSIPLLRATPWSPPELNEKLSEAVDDEGLVQFLTQLRDSAVQALAKAGFARAREYPGNSSVTPARISVTRGAAVQDPAFGAELTVAAQLQVRLEQGMEGVARVVLTVLGPSTLSAGPRTRLVEWTVSSCTAAPDLTRAPDPVVALLSHFKATDLTDLKAWPEVAQNAFAQSLSSALAH
jgi:hypothetical protein